MKSIFLFFIIFFQIYIVSFGQDIPISKILLEAKNYGHQIASPLLIVHVGVQSLFLVENGQITDSFIISTGIGGESAIKGSLGTPLGWHKIWLKSGAGEPLGRLIWKKKVSNVMIPITTDLTKADGDYLITRVLALDGLEKGYNKGTNSSGTVIDTMLRGINIHGTPEEGYLGTKASHGCVRMKNTDIVDLFERVSTHSLVYIFK